MLIKDTKIPKIVQFRIVCDTVLKLRGILLHRQQICNYYSYKRLTDTIQLKLGQLSTQGPRKSIFNEARSSKPSKSSIFQLPSQKNERKAFSRTRILPYKIWGGLHHSAAMGTGPEA